MGWYSAHLFSPFKGASCSSTSSQLCGCDFHLPLQTSGRELPYLRSVRATKDIHRGIDSARLPYPPPLRPRALHRGVGALNVLDQCSARSPRSVLEMVGASSRRTRRLPLTKGTRDRNAVEKRWWPARRIFPIFGAIMSSCSREHRGGVYLVPFFFVPSRKSSAVRPPPPPDSGPETRPSPAL